MHEGAHFTVINACETPFTCCSPDGDTGAYHHPHAWLMRVTAVIFKTWGSFWVWLRLVIFIYWADRVNRRGLITNPALRHSGRCWKGSSLVLGFISTSRQHFHPWLSGSSFCPVGHKTRLESDPQRTGLAHPCSITRTSLEGVSTWVSGEMSINIIA